VELVRSGKVYPGESLPRWAIDVVGRADAAPIFTPVGGAVRRTGIAAARALAAAVAAELGLSADALLAAFEDPWRFLQDEASLPVDVDPAAVDLDASEERRRLARTLDRGVGAEVAVVLPLAREAGAWRTDAWRFRRERLYLVPGDSPAGLRLPLAALGGAAPPPAPAEEPLARPDPRSVPDPYAPEQEKVAVGAASPRAGPKAVRTALCVEPRGEELFVFVPPLPEPEDFLELLRAVDRAASAIGAAVRLEGYAPRWAKELRRITVTPDPGVLEVNLPPSRSAKEHVALLEQVFDAALHAGLHTEKYLLDGRLAGSGGGHHLTLGGPTPLESPFVRRPDLLASLVTFLQHHPSLSYLFTGLFVGPTSQAPRPDEGRHDALAELELAMRRAFERRPEEPPWLGDLLFRDLLVDVSGNGHRAEVSIDKLFDWRTPHGRQGLVELRAFEMPPHPRMAAAQAILVRALVAAFAREPYRHPLVRWGARLHDQFLLPHFLWKDFEDVLAWLAARGVALPADGFRPFLELRFPVAGRVEADGVVLEIRNAMEPWPVLGEEPGAGGTSRFVDSSMERVEIRVEGLVPERHAVLVNGFALPLHPTGKAGEQVGGVRFRAWAPPHALQPHLGIHHPLRFDLVDRWGRRSFAAGAYHVWHPEGRSFNTPPLTRVEAQARRLQRFTVEGPLPWPVSPRPAEASPEAPYTLDLRRLDADRPPPPPEEAEE
jgi:uncharacterized protein (DUF2126 family)